MGWNDFSNWMSAEISALGHTMSSAATGIVNTAKYGLKTIVHTPVAIVHEVSSGVVKVSQAGAGAFTSAATEGRKAFTSGTTAFVAASHEGSLAVQGVSKNIGGAVGSLGSSFAWPLAVVAGLVGVAFVMKR